MPRNRHAKKNEFNLDIVIPVYGRFDLLARVIHKLRDIGNVILVDDKSPDKAEADKFYDSLEGVTIVRNKTNSGFPATCNAGARMGTGTDILFLNSDCLVSNEAIQSTVNKLYGNSRVGVVGLKLVFPDNVGSLDPRIRPAGKIQHLGVSIDIRGNVHHPFVGWSPNHKRFDELESREIWAVTGAYLLTTRHIFNQVGGFDVMYGLGTYEDVDYCLKVSELGYSIRIVTSHTGVHYTGASAETYNNQYPLGYNKQIFMTKWNKKIQWSDWRYY